MIIKQKEKENSLQSKFKVTVKEKYKITFADTFQASNTSYTQVTVVNMAIARQCGYL